MSDARPRPLARETDHDGDSAARGLTHRDFLEALRNPQTAPARRHAPPPSWCALAAFDHAHGSVDHSPRSAPRPLRARLGRAPARPASAVAGSLSPFGVNALAADEASLRIVANAGIGWLRIAISWADVEPVEGERDWTPADRLVHSAHAMGLSVLASLSGVPAWASADGRGTGAPKDPAQWDAYVHAVVDRYRGQLAAVSLWDEPNAPESFGGTRDQYVRDVWRRGLEAVRRADPSLLTVGPDLSGSSAHKPWADWLLPALEAAGDLLDVVALHPGGDHATAAGRVSEIDALHAFLGPRLRDRPLWITQIGWPGVPHTEQALLLRDVMLGMQARPYWARTFWSDLNGAASGLLDPPGSPTAGRPRPALCAYADSIAACAGKDARALPERSVVLVRRAHVGLLGHEPSASALAAGVRKLQQGAGLVTVCNAVAHGPEFCGLLSCTPPETLARQMYTRILERDADDVGLRATVDAIAAGHAGSRAAELLASQEFRSRFLEA